MAVDLYNGTLTSWNSQAMRYFSKTQLFNFYSKINKKKLNFWNLAISKIIVIKDVFVYADFHRIYFILWHHWRKLNLGWFISKKVKSTFLPLNTGKNGQLWRVITYDLLYVGHSFFLNYSKLSLLPLTCGTLFYTVIRYKGTITRNLLKIEDLKKSSSCTCFFGSQTTRCLDYYDLDCKHVWGRVLVQLKFRYE